MNEREKLKRELEEYIPCCEAEERDREMLLQVIDEEDVFLRENTRYHFTASAWIVNREHTKVLMVYHNIYDSWSWTGGHADGEQDLLSVAVR